MEERATVVTTDERSSLTLPERERVSASGVQSSLIVPLLIDDRCIGAAALLLVADAPVEAAFTRFRELAALTALVVERARLADDLRAAADRDDATRLLAGHAFRQQVAARLESAMGAGFVLVELGDAWELEDQHGYSTAERALSAIAGLLADLDEPPLLAGRVGLSGIGLLLRDASAADVVVRRLRGNADHLTIATGTARTRPDIRVRGIGVPVETVTLTDVLVTLERHHPVAGDGSEQPSSPSI